MIKAIIFDYGGVLSSNWSVLVFARIQAKKFKKDPEKAKELVLKKWRGARINKVTSEKFWMDLSNFFGASRKELKKDFIDYLKINKKVLDFAIKLKKGYKIGILTNFIPDLEIIIKKNELRKKFDAIVTSYKTGIAKPNIKIFKIIMKRLKVRPEQCIFVDNMTKNMAPAEKIGMKVILFKDLDQLKRDLKKLKIII